MAIPDTSDAPVISSAEPMPPSNVGGSAAMAPAVKPPKVITCPFTIIVDSREQAPFHFEGFTSNASSGSCPLIVPIRREALPVGDYALAGLPHGAIIERKTKEDLYSSISARRENFKERLRVMCCDHAVAAVIVEADWTELIKDPPRFTQFNPKSLTRTIIHWQIQFPRVHWVLMPSREAAEAYTFRFLEGFWNDYRAGKTWDQDPEMVGRVARIEEMVGTVREGEVMPDELGGS